MEILLPPKISNGWKMEKIEPKIYEKITVAELGTTDKLEHGKF